MNKQWEKRKLGAVFHALLIAISLSVASLSGMVNATQLQSVDFSALPGDRVQLRFGFDGTPPQPQGYNIEKPARIALDLEGVSSALQSKYHELGLGNTRNVTVIEAGSRTRLIISLTQLEPYIADVRDNFLYITIGKGVVDSSVVVADSTGAGTAAASRRQEVNSVDFERGVEGEGKIVITLSDPHTSVNMHKEGDRIHLKFVGVRLPDALVRRLDVVDFATPIREIDATNESDGALIAIRPFGEYEHLAYQTDNTYTVSVKPLSADEAERSRRKTFAYSGEKLSLNFQDIEVRAVLQLIADFTELNLVASDTVGGRITLRLQNVPWDQALDLILKTKGLDKRQIGNVLLVAPAEEIAAREKLELEAGRQVAALAPLQSEFFTIKYAAAADVRQFLTGEGSKITSDRGSVVLDSRTNTLLIQDTAQNLNEIREIVARLDVPVRQVLIEARVVVASSNISDELGVRWGGLGFKNNRSLDHVSGSVSAGTGALDSLAGGGNATIAWPDAYVVDFGVTDPNASSMAVGLVRNGLLEIELSAIEAEGQAEVISTPKILTADAQEAIILSGKKIPIRVATSSGATAVSYIEAVLGLTVTPHITPDNRILMNLRLTQDSVAEFSQLGDPIIDINQIVTHVLVGNGDTVVLGGVFKTQDAYQVFKTPFFGDLPILGRFFRKTTKRNEKQELLVFITPKIVQDLLASN